MTLLLVLVGGALGASCRFLIDRAVTLRFTNPHLPWGTLLVNVSGSLLLGLLAALAGRLSGWYHPLVATGFCGALTTYSTFSHETVRLAVAGPGGSRRAALYVALTLGSGLAAVTLGWTLGHQL